jgi:hypothetical protein
MANANITEQIGRKGADIVGIAQVVIENPEHIAELVEGVQAPRGTIRFGYEKVLRCISERRPEMIYPYFDMFADLLDCDNSFLRWGAIMTIANLTPTDSRKKFEAIFERYYAPIPGPVMITAANVIGSSPRIALAKPHLADRITTEILKVEKARYKVRGQPSPECRNVAIGHAIDSFSQFFDHIEDKPTVLRFVKKQLKNPRPAVAKKAAQFLRKHASGELSAHRW